jgi:hypothetical protein
LGSTPGALPKLNPNPNPNPNPVEPPNVKPRPSGSSSVATQNPKLLPVPTPPPLSEYVRPDDFRDVPEPPPRSPASPPSQLPNSLNRFPSNGYLPVARVPPAPTANNSITEADRQSWQNQYAALSQRPEYSAWSKSLDNNPTLEEKFNSLKAVMLPGHGTTKQKFATLASENYRALWLNPRTGAALVATWRQLNSEWVKAWQPSKPLPEFSQAVSGKLLNQDEVFPRQTKDFVTGKTFPWCTVENLEKWSKLYEVPDHKGHYPNDSVDQSGDRTAISATYLLFSSHFNKLPDSDVEKLKFKQQDLGSYPSLWRDKEYGPLMLHSWNKINDLLKASGAQPVEPPQFLMVSSPRNESEVLPAVQQLRGLFRDFSYWLPGYDNPEPAKAKMMAEGRKELIEMRFWPLAQSYDNFITRHLGSVDAATRATLLNEQKQLLEWIKSEPDTLAARRVAYFGLESRLTQAQLN